MGHTKLLPVAFLNENTLGHGSYLPRFIQELEGRPDLGIRPIRRDVTPMPPPLQRKADHTVRGLRRFGLDFHVARWRRIVSRHAASIVEELRGRERLHAVVLNTQSVGLELTRLAADLPLHVCMDATFAQLRRSRWFSMNRVAGWFTPLTLAPILRAERRLLNSTHRLWPWSAPVRDSLLSEYRIARERIEILPPSLDLRRFNVPPPPRNRRPRILFVGGDFFRKGGRVLLEAYRDALASRCDLHLITESAVPSEPGVHVHRNVAAGSATWLQCWQEADVFVFPSLLETFGIVLVEALAFGVPVVASRAGAAVDILDDGRNGLLLDNVTSVEIAAAIRAVLDNPAAAAERSANGRSRVERDFDLGRNAERLACALQSEPSPPEGG